MKRILAILLATVAISSSQSWPPSDPQLFPILRYLEGMGRWNSSYPVEGFEIVWDEIKDGNTLVLLRGSSPFPWAACAWVPIPVPPPSNLRTK